MKYIKQIKEYYRGVKVMNKIILRIYETPKEWIEKYNLCCKIRYAFYDYKNKIITSAGIPNGYTANDYLKFNKHKFTRVNNI